MQQLIDFCKEYKIYEYTINDDRSISVEGDVDLSSLICDKIPYKFLNVSGKFICPKTILTLENSPESVGQFICKDCINLKS